MLYRKYLRGYHKLELNDIMRISRIMRNNDY